MQNRFGNGPVMLRKSMAIFCFYIVAQPSIGWCDDNAAKLLSAIEKQRQSLKCMEGEYQIIKKIGEKNPKTIGGTFAIEDNKSRYECTIGERPFTYAFDGRITSSLRTKDDTERLIGNLRINARAKAPGIGKPDTNPRTFMLTAFDEPLENFEFYDDEKEIHFSSSATEKTERFKILITGKEGDLIKAETVNIDPELLASQTSPPVTSSKGTIGYSPIPSVFEKIKFTFDITKNCCLVSKEIYAPSGEIQKKTVAKEFALIDNVWIPVRLECIHYLGGKIRMTEDISYSDIKLPDDIDDQQFRIDFPPGTNITNEIVGITSSPDRPLSLDDPKAVLSENTPPKAAAPAIKSPVVAGPDEDNSPDVEQNATAPEENIKSTKEDNIPQPATSELNKSNRLHLIIGGCILLAIVGALILGKRSKLR